MTANNRRVTKPLGGKSYGHIPHLPGSRRGPGDHHCHEGQARIATEKARDRHDLIIVQEKLDGSNVGVGRREGVLYPLTRAGYLASTSPYEQHWRFSEWVYAHSARFLAVLRDGERLCGEWLMQAHGTRYALTHEPFVVFDVMRGEERATLLELTDRLAPYGFTQPWVIHTGPPLSVPSALAALHRSAHGALDPVEGTVWRVERNERINPNGSERAWRVDFLAKYVRPDKQDGIYLPDVSGQPPVWNWRPTYPVTHE
ncbi:MAG: RNA ligase family protein [Acidobacteria bacterium]|nr:RNA ligase family protein [Acidobacteriota bacterium]MBI3657677.1 RNA ligase family protein [Acidobacteriota bacterium]